MTPLPLRLLALVALALPVVVSAAEPPIVARARARLGSDAALDSVKSLHFFGTLTIVDAKDPAKTSTGKVEMIFQKPDQQKITVTYDKPAQAGEHPLVETTALDAYEGWTKLQDSTDATKWRMTLLDATRVKQLRASTWESLNYFRGLERAGGRVEDLGAATQDGVACQKIAFCHASGTVFYRYFDTATARLVATEMDNSMAIRESGEMTANGIKFPKTSITTQGAGDKKSTVTITYDKVLVNETFPAAQFAMPAIVNH